MIKTVIFCGGYGTRIRGVSEDVPKPLIRIGELPILWHVMKIYSQYEINDFVLCLGYKGWLIKEFFLNYHRSIADLKIDLSGKTPIEVLTPPPPENWHVTLAETGLDTQTSGRLWQVRKYLEDSDIFCVTYGDGVANVDIEALIAFHKSHGRIGTVTGVRPAGRFGVLDVEKQDGALIATQFIEKPQSLQGLINGGFFVFDHRLWDFMTDDDTISFEYGPLKDLADAGQLAVYEHEGFWQPMDTYREWVMLNKVWDSGDVPWLK